MSDNEDDDRFFEDCDDLFSDKDLVTEFKLKKDPVFISNLTGITEESRVVANSQDEGVFQLDETKENAAPQINFEDSQSFSFKTGDRALELFNKQRNKREFLRLDPFQSFNASTYPDEKSWEREARNENMSIRDISKSFSDKCAIMKSETDQFVTEFHKTSQQDHHDANLSKSVLSSDIFKVPKLPTVNLPFCDTLQTSQFLSRLSVPTNIKPNINETNCLLLDNTPKRNITNNTIGADTIQKTMNHSQKATEISKISGVKKSDNLQVYHVNENSKVLIRPEVQLLKTPQRFSNYNGSASSIMCDSPTFILNCTSKNGGQKVLEADRPMLYFGFRPINSESEDAIGLINNSDKPLSVKYRVSPALASSIFKIYYKSNSREIIREYSKTYMHVLFCPPKISRFKAKLQIECTTTNGETFNYDVEMLGFGGQAFVRPIPFAEKDRALRLSMNGRYQLFPKTINSFTICFQNTGDRDAFVSIVLQNNHGEELPSDNACANPTNFLLDKKNSTQRVDIRVFMQGSTGTTSSRQSFASVSKISSLRPSSVMDNTATSSVSHSQAFRVLAFWSEERQRRRIKVLEKNKIKDRITILNRHVTWNIQGENQNDGNGEANKFISREDYRLFKGCIRYTLIDILTRQSSRCLRNTSSRTVTGNTLIEVEADNTFKLGDSLYTSHF